jgi:alpha-beta hydrolase superfamily lysophospholipase
MRNWLTPLTLTAVFFTLIIGSGCSSLRTEKTWLDIELTQEFSAKMLGTKAAYDWNDYLQQEDKLFSELTAKLAAVGSADGYRYAVDSALNPLRQTPNWNRSFVLRPEKIRAGIVMLHGLTDSPYSVRHLAQSFVQQGFLVIALRVPGHGTLPSGLHTISWNDWVAATGLAVEEMQRELGDNPNLFLLGYSNGGALALNYALDSLSDNSLPAPKKVVLLSPMIGISRFAMLSKALEFASHLPLMGSHRWLSIQPEYNPYKYNSFSVNAAWQAHSFTKHLQKKIKRLAKTKQLQGLAPMLTFQSIMDSTVKTAALEQNFYRFLPSNHSELVLFDLNRHYSLAPIIKTQANEYLADVFAPQQRNYDLVTIANVTPSTLQVSERRQAAGSLQQEETPLTLEFPANVFSLSHVALPFPTDDSLYGLTPNTDEFYGIHLGSQYLLGETNTLALDTSKGNRLYSNPFYPYMEARIQRFLALP